MSRNLQSARTRASRALSFGHVSEEPRPSTSGEQRRRLLPEVTLPQAAPGDSDWEAEDSFSDDTSVYKPQDSCSDDDDDWEELDYVSTLDTSVESDTPLAQLVSSSAARNAPGTPSFQWKKKECVPQRRGFAGSPGVKVDHLTPDSSALEIFDSFFTPELWGIMEEETNKYAAQHPSPPSRHMKQWEDTTVEELQKFVGLRLLMGVQPRPQQQHFWSTDPLLGCPVFPETMSRDRFTSLRRNLHFADNEDTSAKDDRLAKVRPVVRILGETFRSVFVPGQNIAVDESLWAYRGRHHAVQFNPSKRARFGMKVYKLCASDGPAAGYTSAFNVYMGQDRSDVPSSTKAVLDLMSRAQLFDQGYRLFLDNWYSSPSLFHQLQSRKTMAVGTVRLNRKFMPKDLAVKKRGDVDARSTATGMLALAWQDKKQVNMLSTCHTSEMVELPANRRGEVRSKPRVVVDYNDGMKGVDVSDQLAQSYPTVRKTLKWYMKLFYNFIDMTVVNCHAVHKALGGDKRKQLDFKMELLHQLLRRPTSSRRRSRSTTPARSPAPATPAPSPRRPSPAPPGRKRPRVVPEGHTLCKTEALRYRRCKRCRMARGVRKDTRYYCDMCNVGLCPECFSDFHAL